MEKMIDETIPEIIPDVMAFEFNGKGNCTRSDPENFEQFLQHDDTEFYWVHLMRGSTVTEQWLRRLGLDTFVIDALTEEETRPRCTAHDEGILINLRGVNLSPGSEPEDMIAVRFWVDEKRVIGVRKRPLLATSDLLNASLVGHAPTSPSDLIAKLALRLADRAEPVISSLNERIDALEEAMDGADNTLPKGELAAIRRVSIMLRRYMFPQRDALNALAIEEMDWIKERDRSRAREASDRVTRLGEELDAIRDRAQVVHDQMSDRRAETMNRQMLVLSVVSAVFLPLGLLTGLLGINVGGIPGQHSLLAFWSVCGVLVTLGIVQLWFYRKIGLFK